MSSKVKPNRQITRNNPAPPAWHVDVRRVGTEVQVTFPVQRLAVPQQVYLSDCALARRSYEGMQLLFAKTNPITGRAAGLVEVLVPHASFDQSFWPAVEDVEGPDFLRGLKQYCIVEHPDYKPTVAAGLEEAEYYCLKSNLMAVWYSGDEAILDFFLASTPEMARVVRGENIDVPIDSVLRVLMSTPLLLTLLLECQSLRRGGDKK